MRSLVVALVCGLALVPGATAGQLPAGRSNPFGEPERRSTNHLTVEAQVNRTSVEPGGRVTVTLDISPRRDMHVYAPGKHDYQVVTLTLAPQPWLRVEPTAYPPSEKYYFAPLDETVEVYSKPFRLTRSATVLTTPEAAKALEGRTSLDLAGTLEYQACDDKVCYAPTKVPVRFTVTLEKKAKG